MRYEGGNMKSYFTENEEEKNVSQKFAIPFSPFNPASQKKANLWRNARRIFHFPFESGAQKSIRSMNNCKSEAFESKFIFEIHLSCINWCQLRQIQVK